MSQRNEPKKRRRVPESTKIPRDTKDKENQPTAIEVDPKNVPDKYLEPFESTEDIKNRVYGKVNSDDENIDDIYDIDKQYALLQDEEDSDAGGDDDLDAAGILNDEENQSEDLMENMEKDYDVDSRLDAFDSSQLDSQIYDDMDIEERKKVENILDQRDNNQKAKSHSFSFPKDDFSEDVMDTFSESPKPSRGIKAPPRNRFFSGSEQKDVGTLLSHIDEDEELDLENIPGTITEYITSHRGRAAIAKKFRRFLLECTDQRGNNVYANKIRVACQENYESIEVDFQELYDYAKNLTTLVNSWPTPTLKIFDDELFTRAVQLYPYYSTMHEEMKVRLVNVPVGESLRDLRTTHLNTLIRVTGVVTRRTAVLPQLKYVKYDCLKCGNIMGPYYQESDNREELKIYTCPSCSSKGPFSINSELTTYRNFQKITLQETPGSVSPGRLPRYKEVILLSDLVDKIRPGEEIEVTGVFRNNLDRAVNVNSGFPIFATIIEANHITKKEDIFASFRLDEQDNFAIQELAKQENIAERIFKSMAPSIYGHPFIKRAIALSMFGGQPKVLEGNTIRGDINVLLLGDPGTAKSQFLKYVEKTAHRCVYTTGQGASAVGLTASVHKDPVTREWTLEGGALVLADRGVCLIDEFDKMNEHDRTSIHEAMEQQSISISKAGIITSLQARCAVIAAANPIRGRYDPSIPFSQNVELTEPILSRFDILCVVKDLVDPIADERMGKFIVNSHIRNHPDFELDMMENNEYEFVKMDDDIIPQDLLKKYIVYAKEKIKPKLNNIDKNKISKFFVKLRKEAQESGSLAITVRHFESIIRMAEARARMHLREDVRMDDIDMAIQMMLESFISAQKFSVMKSMQKNLKEFLTHDKDKNELLLHALVSLLRENLRFHQLQYGADAQPSRIDIEVLDLKNKMREFGLVEFGDFFSSKIFIDAGFKLEQRDSKQIICKTFQVEQNNDSVEDY